MKRCPIEFYRAVSDDDGDFDATQDHEFTREEELEFIEEMLTEVGVEEPETRAKDFQVVEWEFCEFDSSNPSHACGYWTVVLEGPDDLVDQVIKHLQEEEGK